MKLGVDVAGLGPTRSGVHRYLWSMLTEMMTAAPEIEILLYTHRPADVPLPPGNWILRLDSAWSRMPYPLWLQRRCPVLLAADRVDAFWGQNHMLPLSPRRRLVRMLTVHDATAVVLPRTMSLMNRVTARLYFRRAVRAADCVVSDSSATARLVQSSLGALPGRTIVVYPGCGSGFVPVPKAHAKSIVAARFGLASDFLLTVGNIEPRKAHHFLMRAHDITPNAPMLVIVGALAWRSQTIAAEIRNREQAGRVRFLGYVEDSGLALLYSAAEFAIFPSFYEGFGLTVLEAMSCGCPVLCRWSSSLPEVGGRASAYFRGHSPNELGAAIRRLLADRAALAGMSRAGIQRATEFSFRHAAEQIVSILQQQALRK